MALKEPLRKMKRKWMENHPLFPPPLQPLGGGGVNERKVEGMLGGEWRTEESKKS